MVLMMYLQMYLHTIILKIIIIIGLTAQYRLEKNGYVKIGKVVGGGGCATAGAIIGFNLAGPGGAVIGAFTGLALWFLGDTIVHACRKEENITVLSNNLSVHLYINVHQYINT